MTRQKPSINQFKVKYKSLCVIISSKPTINVKNAKFGRNYVPKEIWNNILSSRLIDR